MAEKKADIWMPLWIGAYLADTSELTTIQHGAYMLLLMSYWRKRKPLPDNDEKLRAITKTSPAEWEHMRSTLAEMFRVADGVWWHKRVEAEMLEADKRANAASSKAKRAAEARWGKSSEECLEHACSIPQAKPEQYPPPSPIPPAANTPPSPIGDAPPMGVPTSFPDTPMEPVPHHVTPLVAPPLPEPEPAKLRRRVKEPVPRMPCPGDVNDDTWSGWLDLRHGLNAPPTQNVVKLSRSEAGKAGMTFEDFLDVWCVRGSRGLFAAWLTDDERSHRRGGQQQAETAYQRSQRERAAEISPSTARRDPAAQRESATITTLIDQEFPDVLKLGRSN